MQLPLKGIIPPLVTPLLENGDLDSSGLKNLIEYVLAGGVHGIFLLGTTGEGPSLSYAIRKQLISEACGIINNRVPVLVGITDTCMEAAIDIANHSKIAGVDALVVAPPYYFPISEQEMVDYLKDLAPKLLLPFFLYNMPSCTKLNMSNVTIKKALEFGAIGVKDSSGDYDALVSIIKEFKQYPEFSIFAGTELFLSDTILKGGHGAVAGGANFFPRLFVDLYEASLRKDLKKITVLKRELQQLEDTIYAVGDTPVKSIKVIKAALSIMGICSEFMAQPLSKANAKERKMIKGYLSLFTYSKDYSLKR